MVALAAALAYRGDLARMPLVLFSAGFLAAALKTTNLFPVAAISVLFCVGAIAGRERSERWDATMRKWVRDGGALLAGGLLAAAAWALIHRSLSLIELKDEPTFEVLRTSPRTLGLVLDEAVELMRPITSLNAGFFNISPQTLDQNAQAPFYAILTFLLIGAGLAGLFTAPRRWPHALGLICVPMLYVGGVIFGLGVMLNYDIDPALSGRYALSMAPLLLLVLAALLTGRWAQRTVALFAGAFFLTTFTVMVT